MTNAPRRLQPSQKGLTCMYMACTLDSMVNDRRPRIPLELAAKIDELRAHVEQTFEEYVADVLERHVERMADRADVNDIAFQASRKFMHGFEDPAGVIGIFDALPLGGWGDGTKYPDVMAGFVIDDTDSGFESLGIYLTEQELRALRDAITDVLNDGPWTKED